MAVASAGSLLTEVVSTTLFQRIVPDAIRGRALGTIATISTLAYAAGSLVMPVAAGVVGVEPVLARVGRSLVVVGAIVSVLLIGRGGDRRPVAGPGRRRRRVGGLPVFAGVPAGPARRRIQPGGRASTSPAGTVVIRQGEPADRFYVILDGHVRRRPGRARRCGRARLRTMGPDEVFGEIGLLTGVAAQRDGHAPTTDGRLLALDAPDFLESRGGRPPTSARGCSPSTAGGATPG